MTLLRAPGHQNIIAATPQPWEIAASWPTKENRQNFGNFPIELCYPDECDEHRSRSINSPSVGDIDGDGKPEIAVATNEAVINETRSVSYLIDALTGEYEEGWPLAVRGLVGEAVLLPLIGEGHPSSLTIADVDGDGDGN